MGSETYTICAAVEFVDCSNGIVDIRELDQGPEDGWITKAAGRKDLALALEEAKHNAIGVKRVQIHRSIGRITGSHLQETISNAFNLGTRRGDLLIKTH